MNQLIIQESINIEDLIYEIRGKQVMFAYDVARLYGVETKRINEIVKRNLNRFPLDFCFQLTEAENKIYSSRSQIATLNKSNNLRGSNTKYLPYVFTEHGIMMLSGLLKSDVAAEVNKKIIVAFVAMRKYLSINNYDRRISNLETKIIDYDNKFDELFDRLEPKVNNHIFFEGQIYDAYSLLLDIFNTSKKNIIIIDNYFSKNLLDLLSKTDKKVTIYSKNYDDELIKKYNKQYSNIKCIYNNSFHDRFIIIDNKTLYHSGASFKELGTKCFAINKIDEYQYLEIILKHL